MGLLALRVATTVASSRAGPQEAEIATSGSAPARPDHSAPNSATTVSSSAAGRKWQELQGRAGGVQASPGAIDASVEPPSA